MGQTHETPFETNPLLQVIYIQISALGDNLNPNAQSRQTNLVHVLQFDVEHAEHL